MSARRLPTALVWLLVGASHFLAVSWALQTPVGASIGTNTPFLDIERLQRTIAMGRVYQHENFLSETEVQILLEEIRDMEEQGKFQRKGLSNTVLKNQTFDAKLDRSICPVPWFPDALEGKDRRPIPSKLYQLQHTLSRTLQRTTMAWTGSYSPSPVFHECYYSKSEVGSRLPRHMDERHEETKGAKGWLAPSRRSLSWLIYLSTPKDWTLETNGGALRAFPQANVNPKGVSSVHQQNLQVGWLLPNDNIAVSRPVYLDSWHPVIGVVAEGTIPEPHCILYTVDVNGEREYLTKPWLTEQLKGLPMSDFMTLCADHDSTPSKEGPLLFLNQDHAKHFSPLEDRPAWDRGEVPKGSEMIDIIPKRGSLVVFDSVQLPHQVEVIKNGTRLALAGWFHERTQEFPENFYESSA